ncbi:hypothetical protein EHS25_007972 [Saitozyma podzolica]|uniref:Uncharacterized protein n=1 Tax=Saitozyma podzolica TaxID=1890683 RepID=A0A427XL73_9TREE|nr:hypothetical protein EHS25_007972 [Saitozyma podzolica]
MSAHDVETPVNEKPIYDHIEYAADETSTRELDVMRDTLPTGGERWGADSWTKRVQSISWA